MKKPTKKSTTPMTKPMAKTAAQPKPAAKTPVKKYTAQDSVNYRGMEKRQESDFDALFKNFPKKSPAESKIQARMDRRTDSLTNSPYFKAKAKVSVKNGVTTRTLVENYKKAKSTKPAPVESMKKSAIKGAIKGAAVKKTPLKSTKK